MGKVTIAALIAGIAWGWVSVLDAAYVIKLKNGNEYVTARYWQEGAQVLFDTYGGTFGIEREFITKIAELDQRVSLDTVTARNSAIPGPEDSKKETKDAESKSAVASETEKKRDPDDPIVREFNRFKEKSKEVDGMLTSEIRDLLKEIKAFKDKISGDSKLFLNYGREFNDVHEISSAVEVALESRR
ncbi:MAG TPA: hypothetical protein VFP18_02770 [Candidatus Binatia bacterium]|nr:hypothetical protein [Candidatus Binatia bacterium]